MDNIKIIPPYTTTRVFVHLFTRRFRDSTELLDGPTGGISGSVWSRESSKITNSSHQKLADAVIYSFHPSIFSFQLYYVFCRHSGTPMHACERFLTNNVLLPHDCELTFRRLFRVSAALQPLPSLMRYDSLLTRNLIHLQPTHITGTNAR